MNVAIEGKVYGLEIDPKDPFVSSELKVGYCRTLAEDFLPVLIDSREYGSKPYPPDIIAYRLVLDSAGQRLCALYEVYWRRQDCDWQNLNKDHDHDYVENAGHGVEVFSNVTKASVKTVVYTTSPAGVFPWGGRFGHNNATQIRNIPMDSLFLKEGKPVVLVLNCYHAFSGLKRKLTSEERRQLTPSLERLDRRLLYKWYYKHATNKFGHDISRPFDKPYIMYAPPPEDWMSKLAYGFLWIFSYIKSILGL
jgi:hypothetical protein